MFPHRFVTHKLSCALIALCFLSAACANKQQDGITEQKIAAILEEIDEAARNKDVDSLLKHISKDAQIKMRIEGLGPGVQSMSFTRDQYRDYAMQGYGVTEAYEYERKDTIIKVDAGGQFAMVGGQVVETATMGGRTFRSVTMEKATFKMENGQVVITNLEGDARVD